MATNFDMSTVCVVRPPGVPLGDFFGDMRAWLDNRRIEPLAFKSVVSTDDENAFEISFGSFDEANAFGQDFA